jgi:sugar phosphate isomerase/epimerase
MNHPEKNVVEEIAWMAGLGMEFLDLTLEPPGAPSWDVDIRAIRNALERNRMSVVGHTAWYIPMASSIHEIRRAAVAELRRCLHKFAEAGAKWMNIHPDRHTPWHPRSFFIEQNLLSFQELMPDVEKSGVGLMIENLPGDYNSAQQLRDLLEPMPQIGLHLDIGHANLQVSHNTTEEILAAFGDRLKHVHLHDNKGGHADLHLPLGAGNVDVERAVRNLQSCGYDGTITLEVFTEDKKYLAYSRDKLRAIWTRCAAERPALVSAQ